MNTTNKLPELLIIYIRPHFIFFDMFLISSIFLGCIFCISFIYISVGYRSCHSVLTLLSANSCVAGLIFNCVQLSNALLLFRDDIYLSTSNQNQYCEIRNYLMHVSGSLLYYSYCIQSISRLCFVVFYKHSFLLSYHIHFILIAIQWTLGFLLPISILTSSHRQYQTETSQCFITIKNVSQILYGMISTFLLPITIISICYTHIICFVRAAVRRAKKTNALPARRFNLKRDQGAIQIEHRFSNTKDIKVFRHIIILITVLYIGGFPYSMLMVLNAQSIAPFSMYRLCITVFALTVTVDMGAIFFFNKNVRTIFFNRFQRRTNRIASINRD
ncbi:unnamed protein product [Rotaria magnacalcarata]|uniref:G-protein coupled receptors family 1 profile domain-containing protein n=2 Tax=Rotaria magnacalcarata TaxID=392030 RepID=A0A814S5K2_9BILA|nr:unnamed protein product [Rotaria magnacalcarata]CAF2047019.1 unnamed protein product [Rotaria magnacalcarata]CAF4079201.1 unnamed protein product [Rotaria magnacalcarata]